MSPIKMDPWTVLSREIETVFVTDPDIAPYYRIGQVLRVAAQCPKGHKLPARVGATREVVELLGGDGAGFACATCGVNYELHFGLWPQTP